MSELVRLLKQDLHSQWRSHTQNLLATTGLSAPILADQSEVLVAWLVAELAGESHATPVDYAAAPDFGLEAVTHLGLGPALEAVVSEFNTMRTCLFELAGAGQLAVDGAVVLGVNRLLDNAIAAGVKALADHHDHRRVASLATAVHDLRTPLTALSLATSLLERLVHPVPESDERALLDIMRLNVDKQARLFQQVFAEDSAEPV